MRTPQYELPNSAQAFNLAGEAAEDPWRVQRERAEAEKRLADSKAFQDRMQRTLAECPGVVAFDTPTCQCGKGKVVVEPGRIMDAMQWLKRRFVVDEVLELSTDSGLCVEIAARNRRSPAKGKRVKVTFGCVEQFTLPLFENR